MTEGPLRVYEAEIDAIEAKAETFGRFWRWYYRWQVWRLRRDLAVLRDEQLQALLRDSDSP